MKGGKSKTGKGQRSNVKNPNNPAHKADGDNRGQQLDPKNPKHSDNQPKKGK